MQSRIAVEVVIGSPPRARAATGSTAATGSRAKRMITSPMVAFQKPMANHGIVTANSESRTTSRKPTPPAESAVAASQRSAAIVAPIRRKNSGGRQAAGSAAVEIPASLPKERSSMQAVWQAVGANQGYRSS